VWLVLGLGLIAAAISVFVIPVAVKGWRLAEDWQKRSDLERRLVQNPRDAHALHALGLKLAAMEDSAESLIYLEKALELAATNLIFGNDYRLQCAHFKEHQRSITFLSKLAHERHPTLFEPRLLLALAYVDRAAHEPASATQRRQWIDAAVEELSHVIQSDLAEPDGERRKRNAEIVWMALYLRGLLYLHSPQRLSHTSRAIDDFQRCLTRQQKTSDPSRPYFALPHVALGDAYVKNGQLSAARRVWKDALRQFSQNKQLQQRLAMNDESLVSFVKATRENRVEVDLSILWK
jgi:tetratricopeptide (TPR) repeat protein